MSIKSSDALPGSHELISLSGFQSLALGLSTSAPESYRPNLTKMPLPGFCSTAKTWIVRSQPLTGTSESASGIYFKMKPRISGSVRVVREIVRSDRQCWDFRDDVIQGKVLTAIGL